MEHPALVTEEVTSMTTMGRNLLHHPPPPRPVAHELARHSKEWHSADPESGELAHEHTSHSQSHRTSSANKAKPESFLEANGLSMR